MVPELAPGWEYVMSLPVAVPTAQRAAFNSVVGFVRLAVSHMTQSGLLLPNRDTGDDAASYTPRYRLRVQLRELALRRLFEIAQRATREGAEVSDNASSPLAK